jgi:membrane protein YdbS with pleckstrin-like domain
MKCQHCGAEIVAGAAFCHACGKSLAPVAAMTEGKKAFTSAVAGRGKGEDPDDVLWEGHFSKLAMLGSWITAGALTLGTLIVGFAAGFDRQKWFWALAANAAVWIVLLLRLVYLQLSVHYRLTAQRFVHERGLLWRQQDRIETIDIDDVTVRQGPVQRMLGVGTVRIVSSDQSTPEFVLVGIEDVRQVATLIDDARRKERRKRGVHIESI